MYMNAQSVLKKIDELKVKIEELRPDMLAIVETWTNEQIEDSYLWIKGYEVIVRQDRNDTEWDEEGE